MSDEPDFHDDRDTDPLIHIREETGLPPPRESGVRRVLALADAKPDVSER